MKVDNAASVYKGPPLIRIQTHGYARIGRTANPCRHHRWPHGFVHNPSWIHEVAYAIQGEKFLPFVVPKIHRFDCLSGLPLHTQVFSQFL